MQNGPSQILPFVFLGNYLDGRALHRLKELGISQVLNGSDSARFSEDPAIEVRHIPISDFANTKLLEEHMYGACTLQQSDIGPSVQQLVRDLRKEAFNKED